MLVDVPPFCRLAVHPLQMGLSLLSPAMSRAPLAMSTVMVLPKSSSAHRNQTPAVLKRLSLSPRFVLRILSFASGHLKDLSSLQPGVSTSCFSLNHSQELYKEQSGCAQRYKKSLFLRVHTYSKGNSKMTYKQPITASTTL